MLNPPDKRLALQAYEQVLGLIVSRQLAPGDVIQERRLAEHLEMSRTPIRDALLMLEKEGLLVRNQDRGLHVRKMDIKDFVENLAIRSLLEPEAVRLAVGKIDDQKLTALEQAFQGILDRKTAGVAPERDEVRAADEDLHSTIAAAADNRQMAAMISMLRQQTRIFDIRNLPQRIEDTCREHLAIVAAIKSGDHEDAVQAMRQHLGGVRKSIIDYLVNI